MVIWKFPLAVCDLQTVEMPIGAQILSVHDQAGGLQMWAIVNPDADRQLRTIEIAGTGNPIPDVLITGHRRRHIATVQTRGGSLVWHVFEIL